MTEAASQTSAGRVARGTFVVEFDQPTAFADGLGQMHGRKTWDGDASGTSELRMVSAMGSVEGSAGYVCMERLRLRLEGREGTFVAQHWGLMTAGEPTLSIVIVPDTGTDGLAGISGGYSIDIVNGVHHYELTYDLPQ